MELRIRATASGQAILPRPAIDQAKGGKVVKRKSSDKPIGKEHQNLLRRVEDSTDALRERSLQQPQVKKTAVLDGSSVVREGRQFTVANVGNNGMIYLRFVESVRCMPGQ